MALPEKFFLTDLLRQRVRCDQGIDHGPGLMAWMHPPVHRLLGWVSKPSSLQLSRKVWRLNQLKGIGNHQAFVKGLPSDSDQATIDRLPTLLEADLLSKHGSRLGGIADLVFDPLTGKILYYLVARTDPRIPGTSRWRLELAHIIDQQPGMVSTDLKELDDIPLARSSLRQDFIRKSRRWRDQIQVISDQASSKLEGWLEEPSWTDDDFIDNSNENDLDFLEDQNFYPNDLDSTKYQGDIEEREKNTIDYEEDPWI